MHKRRASEIARDTFPVAVSLLRFEGRSSLRKEKLWFEYEKTVNIAHQWSMSTALQGPGSPTNTGSQPLIDYLLFYAGRIRSGSLCVYTACYLVSPSFFPFPSFIPLLSPRYSISRLRELTTGAS